MRRPLSGQAQLPIDQPSADDAVCPPGCEQRPRFQGMRNRARAYVCSECLIEFEVMDSAPRLGRGRGGA